MRVGERGGGLESASANIQYTPYIYDRQQYIICSIPDNTRVAITNQLMYTFGEICPAWHVTQMVDAHTVLLYYSYETL